MIQFSYSFLPRLTKIRHKGKNKIGQCIPTRIHFPNEHTLEKSIAGRNLAILHLSFVEDLDMFRHTIEQVVL